MAQKIHSKKVGEAMRLKFSPFFSTASWARGALKA